MTFHSFGWLAATGCLALFWVGCNDGRAGGADGGGGTGAEVSRQSPGLWKGEANGVQVCFYVGQEGSQLTKSAECDVSAQPSADAHSYDISVSLVGTDENGDPCSFELGFVTGVPIDQATDSFRVSGFQAPGSDARLSFSGAFTGSNASGVARSESGGSFCEVGWAASETTPCTDAAIQTCLDLQDCCEAILVNPVFLESCNSVVRQCDQAQCQQVLDGYPQCAPEPASDAGAPDAG